jgi:hypothetical protein
MMMRLTVFPYMTEDVKFDIDRPPNFHKPINEEYFDIEGFDLKADGTLSFVIAFTGNRMVKRAATLKLDKSQIFQLQKILEGHKLNT